MKREKITFYIVKLFLLIIAAVCAALFAFLATSIVQPFENDLVYNCVISGFPMIFFFWFIFSIESKIKVPEDKDTLTSKYFAVFTLRETAVYLIFLIPLTLIYIFNADFLSDGGFIYLAYTPHTLFLHLTHNALINLAALIIIYAAVAFTAHKLQCKKKSKAVILQNP